MPAAKRKIIVVDDDPTGSQTVHGCLLLTAWDVDILEKALRDDSPLFFILSNTRSLSPPDADRIIREIARNLLRAIEQCAASGLAFSLIWVSRSDSTLRGHFPLETDAFEEVAGPFKRLVLIPAFIQGGRITENGVHYLIDESGKRLPVNQTEFAKDSVFGFSHAFLPKYVEEKTNGSVPAAKVGIVSIESIREKSIDFNAMPFPVLCVDALSQIDLDTVATSLWKAVEKENQSLLLRSGAGIIASLASLAPQPTLPEAFHRYRRSEAPGAFLVGSHVEKTTRQIRTLEKMECIQSLEIELNELFVDESKLLDSVVSKLEDIHKIGKTPLIYTSRQEFKFATVQARIDFGLRLSAFLVKVARSLPKDIAYLVCKGGITSNDVLSKALRLRSSRLLGQISVGCSVVQCPSDHETFPNLPVVIFPGNVGTQHGLVEVFQRFEKPAS